MKKIILIIVMMVVLITTLAGCAVAITQTSRWLSYEKYTYSVSNEATEIGTLTVISERIKFADVTIGETLYSNQNGTKLSYDLVLTSSTDKIHSEVFFNTRFVPFYSYKDSTLNNIRTIISATYDGANYNYQMSVNDQVSNDTIKMKTPYFDNEMVYFMLRSIDMTGSVNALFKTTKYYTYSFNCPNPVDNISESRTATEIGKVDVADILGATVSCYQVNMTLNQRITGDAFILYFAETPITVAGAVVEFPLVKFVENGITYKLTALEAIE